VRFETKAMRLVTDDRGAVTGVAVRTPTGTETHSGRRGRARVGRLRGESGDAHALSRPNWSSRVFGGTPYNTGDGIRMALDIGALPWGHWSGCHSVQWDLNAPWHGDRKVGDNFQKHSYPLGLIVNLRGERSSTRAPTSALHLRQVRARGHRAAAPDGLPDLRPEGAASPA